MYVKYANESTQTFDKLSHIEIKHGNNQLLMFIGELIPIFLPGFVYYTMAVTDLYQIHLYFVIVD